MRAIPEIEALRILASANERDTFSAHIETLQARIQLLIAKRDAAQAEVVATMKRVGVDPSKHSVITKSGGQLPVGAVVNTADGKPAPDPEPEQAVVMDKANGHETPNSLPA